jgi:hypothetical protein
LAPRPPDDNDAEKDAVADNPATDDDIGQVSGRR